VGFFINPHRAANPIDPTPKARLNR